MKKITIALTALILVVGSTTKLKAQEHEVKTNVLGLLFNEFGVTYEYVMNENMGLLGTVSYYSSPSSFGYEYTSFRVTADFRYYLNPDEDGDGYFVGGYLKYRNTSADEYTIDFNTGEFVSQKSNGVALGITTGRKWVTDSGFMFESYVGFGRYLIDSETYSDGYDPDAQPINLDDLPAWDFRLGIAVGWRF